MARRRGVPLDDPESVERRRWHLQLQEKVFQSVSAKTLHCSSDKTINDDTKMGHAVDVEISPVVPTTKKFPLAVSTTSQSHISLLSKPESPV